MENGKSSEWPSNARICRVVRRDDFDGYGFNLHAEKGKPGQFVGKVDPGSPAETAGLRPGDKILAVNGASILQETHAQVVKRIRAVDGEATLVVVDPNEKIIEEPPEPVKVKPLDLPATAAELRAQLAARKKYDPKKESIDFRQKYEIVQKL